MPDSAGERVVREHEVEALALEQLEPLLRRAGAGDGVALALEDDLERLADVDVVLDEEDPQPEVAVQLLGRLHSTNR